MKVVCPNCKHSGNISDELIPKNGKAVGCPKCKERFIVREASDTQIDIPSPISRRTLESKPMNQLTEMECPKCHLESNISKKITPNYWNKLTCPRCKNKIFLKLTPQADNCLRITILKDGTSLMGFLNTNQLLTAANSDIDLVKISENPSDDFCDLYAGMVFSISGKDPYYPPIAAIPNLGPPFHDGCRHSLHPFVTHFISDDEVKARGFWDDSDEYGLLLKRNGAGDWVSKDNWTVADISKRWAIENQELVEKRKSTPMKGYPKIRADRLKATKEEIDWKTKYGWSTESKVTIKIRRMKKK